jgi:hypothetical protein
VKHNDDEKSWAGEHAARGAMADQPFSRGFDARQLQKYSGSIQSKVTGRVVIA